MFTLFLVLVIVVGILLSIAVLLQAGSGGGLASMGGGQMDTNIVGGRQAVTLLTKATWWLGGVFLFLALMLSVLSANRTQAVSAVQQQLQSSPVAPAQPSLPFGNSSSGTPAGTAAPTGGATGAPASTGAGSLPVGNAPAPAATPPAPANKKK